METPLPTQNLHPDLLTQVKPAKEPLPKGFWTLLGIEILGAVLAGVAGFFGRLFLAEQSSFWTSGIIASLFLAVSSFGTLFDPVRWRRMTVIFLEALVFFLFFGGGGGDIRVWGSALAAIFIFSLWGDGAAQSEMADRVKLKVLPVFRLKIGRSFTGYLIAVIILTIPVWQNSAVPIPQSQFRSIYDTTIHLTGTMYPGVRLDSTVGEFARTFAAKQLAQTSDFGNLPPQAQEQETRNAADTLLKQATTSFGFPVQASDLLSDVFYNYLAHMITGWKATLGDSFLTLWAIALFILLRGVGAILVWLGMLIALGIYELLSAMSVMSVVGEPSMREIPIISKG